MKRAQERKLAGPRSLEDRLGVGGGGPSRMAPGSAFVCWGVYLSEMLVDGDRGWLQLTELKRRFLKRILRSFHSRREGWRTSLDAGLPGTMPQTVAEVARWSQGPHPEHQRKLPREVSLENSGNSLITKQR